MDMLCCVDIKEFLYDKYLYLITFSIIFILQYNVT